MLSPRPPRPGTETFRLRTWLAGLILLAALPLAAALLAQTSVLRSTAAIVAAAVALCATLGLALLLARLAARRLEQDARRLAEAAQSSSRANDEFLAILSHELRNPLGALCAAVDVLQSVETQGETATEARLVIARQTRNLSQMVNDLLDVSRLVTGKTVLVRQPVDLAALVQRVQRTVALTAPGQVHQLSCQLEPAWASADTVRLEQIVSTLALNALTGPGEGGTVLVRVRREGQTAVIELQVSAARGLGTGLMLVRRLAELHDTTLDVETSQHGSLVTVRLPAVEPVPAASEDTLPARRRRQCLVMGDSGDGLAALLATLESDGHTVRTAGDGHDGLRQLLRHRPEVTIVGIGLAGQTGYQVARDARAAGYAGRMIALSGRGHGSDVAAALAAGFDAILVEPVDRRQLRASMNGDRENGSQFVTEASAIHTAAQ